MIKNAIAKAIENIDLNRDEAVSVMDDIMSGRCTDAQIGSFLTALRLKGESVEEITGFAEVMREKATPINSPDDVIDIVGTGGDSLHTFNVSTASCFVVAAAGARVAKHGNRSVSSSSGSADVLKTLGINIEADVSVVERCITEVGIGFMFAPLLHGAMKYAIGPRREIGVRTVFNILGPLTNPAGARRQLLGVYDSTLTPVLALVLKGLGSERVMVVHGHDGLDEISIAEETTVSELKDGEVEEYVIAPEDFDLKRVPLDMIVVKNSEESANLIRRIFDGEECPARDITLLNAGAALAVAGKAADMMSGIELAAQAIDSGRAKAKVAELIEASNQ